MGKYGLKIKNYQAASIYEYQNGFRMKPHSTDAMLINSLFLDYLYTLPDFTVYKEESTRDVICLEFGYKTKGYEELSKKLKKDPTEYKMQMLYNVEKNRDKCVEINRKQLRENAYVDGVDLTYNDYNKKGKIIKSETIHYKMLYRTPGKAKKGTCMFINEKLYDRVRDFLYMGIQLPEENAPVVEIGAYSSLITSAIVGRIKIEPEEILIVDDLPTSYRTNVVKVCVNEANQCYAEKANDYEVGGDAFDGQALIDYSIFPEWADGYVLLRHHFTKCAAFKTNIEQFMRDHFGADYETATVKDMFGRDVPVRGIKLITTNNAIKFLKFGIGFDYWAEWVRKNGSLWGVVKTAHPSKLGEVQRMSYQMINSLNIDTMDSVLSTSVAYIEKLKSDDNAFLDYLRANVNFSNDYDVLLALCEHNSDFIYSSYFRDRKRKIIETYVLNFKSGRAIQNADNLTIVGSPYAMLLHSIGLNARDDPTFKQENDCIQVWTGRFGAGEYLAEFRNPFNSRNNLGYVHNVWHEYFNKYFDFGKLIIAVNTVDTDMQSRNNGSDQDSDSIYTTNQPDIVAHAKYCYANYPTIVNEVPMDKKKRDSSMKSFADVDNELTAAQLAIGESSNLAQLALTYTYNFDDQKYEDLVCILAVVAQIAIDNAKRKSVIELDKEIPRIKQILDTTTVGLPKFWQITKKDKRKIEDKEEKKKRDKENREKIEKLINPDLVCPMNKLFETKLREFHSSHETMDMKEFFVPNLADNDRHKSKAVEEMIEKYSLDLFEFYRDDNWKEHREDTFLMMENFDELIADIRSLYISKNYQGMMSWLINRALCVGAGVKRNKKNIDSATANNRALLLKVLYTVSPKVFLSCFVEKPCTVND